MTVRLTARGVGALVLGALLTGCGLWWRYPGLAALGISLTLIFLVGVASVLFAAPVTPVRTVRPRTVQRLGACTGTLELTSRAKRLRVLLDGTDEIAGEPVPVDIPVLAPGERTKLDYRIPTDRRGVWQVGPLTLRRRGLAALAEARTTVGSVIEVRVVPRVLPVRGLPSGARRGQVGADERVERGGTDLVGLREYVPGDDLRRLHWATSARTGTLMIREDADPARPHLAVVLDDRAAGYPDPRQFEDAVEVAASLLTAAIGDGHPVRLLTVSGSVDVEVAASTVDGDAAAVLAALAELGMADGVAAASVPVRDLDVVAVICGAESELSALLLEAGRAAFGVVLSVDPSASGLSALGGVLVVRAADAEGLLRAWDTGIAR
ncbi:FIG002343: hypothetical protein [Alloactinosynnema sp. L-07]|uniref:DUF58 domain-containing protein n=1 Tax=Alloactinosynnema sp. L-07 TaxID=1653480 RepID=UPI00065EF935|nr:DUF58 domain-containing protein [Alloactinosynnema sp. L-07]CRK55596.1 FIG002343: hypothetical protein [Alloactinosynnema sp. L-07]